MFSVFCKEIEEREVHASFLFVGYHSKSLGCNLGILRKADLMSNLDMSYP